jgi:hypothetical protein
MWEIIVLIVLVIILATTVGTLSYACFNLIKKIEVYEEWTEMFREEINQMYRRLKEVDDRNLFEKDDDVGATFSDIVRICKEFNDKVK